MQVVDVPAFSTELNHFENIWGSLARMVYANGRQFNNVYELEKAVVESVEIIS